MPVTADCDHYNSDYYKNNSSYYSDHQITIIQPADTRDSTAWDKINGGCGFGICFGEQKCTGEVLQGTLSVSVVWSSEASTSWRFLMY